MERVGVRGRKYMNAVQGDMREGGEGRDSYVYSLVKPTSVLAEFELLPIRVELGLWARSETRAILTGQRNKMRHNRHKVSQATRKSLFHCMYGMNYSRNLDHRVSIDMLVNPTEPLPHACTSDAARFPNHMSQFQTLVPLFYHVFVLGCSTILSDGLATRPNLVLKADFDWTQ